MTLAINDGDPKTYIVLGMHQSGTSFISKALTDQKVEMGVNNKAVYENMEFVKHNSMLLTASGGSWKSPPKEENLKRVLAQKVTQTRMLLSRFKRQFWGFKDPRTALVAPAYLPYLEGDPYLVCIFRKPEKVGNSLHRREGMNKSAAIELAKKYNRLIVKAIEEFCEL